MDYEALATKFGGKPQGTDFDALAAQFGGKGASAAPASDLDALAAKFGAKEPTPESQSAWRQVADVPLHVGTGVVQGVRMITDALGADNPISQTLRGVEDYIGAL